jgi:hypothetical protein
MLKIMSDKYINFKSNKDGTFHLGNNMSNWQQSSSPEGPANAKEIVLGKFCPVSGVISDELNELSLQNHLNCGRWFLGNQSITLPSKNHAPQIYVPGFVRPGYEGLYLQRYSKHLHYSEAGRPLKPDFRFARGKKNEAQDTFKGLVSRPNRWKQRVNHHRGRRSDSAFSPRKSENNQAGYATVRPGGH